MKAELRTFLLADAGLLALVAHRIEWDVLPQGGSLPAIALHLISAPRDYTMRGRDGLVGFLVQMDVWADNRDAREAVASALVTALDGVPSGILKAAFIENERSTFDPADGPASDGSAAFLRTSLDVRVWATEA